MIIVMLTVAAVQATCFLFALASLRHVLSNPPTKIIQRLYLCLQAVVNDLRFKRAFLAGKTVDLIANLHREQGSAVHIGPVVVSNTVEGFEKIYGTSSKHEGVYPKSTWYTFVSGYPDLFSDRDASHHARTRKLFSESFTPRSISGHEETMLYHKQRLLEVVGRAQGGVMRLNDAFQRYATDVMFDILIGKQLNCLEGKDHVGFVSYVPSHFYWATIRDHLRGPVGLALGIVLRIIFHKEIAAQKSEAAAIIKERLHGTHERRDIMTEVLSRSGVVERDDKDLFLNFRAVLSASIHTTSTAMSSTMWFVLNTPSVRAKLVREVRDAFPDAKAMTTERLTHLPYLNAVINESLRLYPPVPVLGGRISPGTKVDGVEVPRGREMYASLSSLHTNKLYHERPTEFLPERWLGSVDSKARAAYQPFSIGSRSCPGKQLALQVLRLTIASLLVEFDGEYVGTVQDWVTESNCHAIYDSPPLLTRLRPMPLH